MVPKKGGFTVIRNEKNELIPTRTMTRWRVYIDYRKLNIATKKDNYTLPFNKSNVRQVSRTPPFLFS